MGLSRTHAATGWRRRRRSRHRYILRARARSPPSCDRPVAVHLRDRAAAQSPLPGVGVRAAPQSKRRKKLFEFEDSRRRGRRAVRHPEAGERVARARGATCALGTPPRRAVCGGNGADQRAVGAEGVGQGATAACDACDHPRAAQGGGERGWAASGGAEESRCRTEGARGAAEELPRPAGRAREGPRRVHYRARLQGALKGANTAAWPWQGRSG